MATHHNTHTGIRPYSCNDCNHQFTNWPNYNKHMKRRHGIDVSTKNSRGKIFSQPRANINIKIDDPTRKTNTAEGKVPRDQKVYNETPVEEEHDEDEEIKTVELEDFDEEYESEEEKQVKLNYENSI